MEPDRRLDDPLPRVGLPFGAERLAIRSRLISRNNVLSGEIGVRIGDCDYVAGPGSYVFKPRGIPHTFWNSGPEPAHLLEVIWPAGFEDFFAALGELAASCPPEDFPERRATLARDYDHYFVHPEWADELKQRYGLKLLGED